MVQIYDGKVLVLDTETGFKASLLTYDNLSKQTETIQLAYHEDLGLVLPEVTGRIRLSNTHRLNGFFKRAKSVNFNLDSFFEPVRNSLEVNNTPLSEESIKELLSIPQECYANNQHSLEEDILVYCGTDAEVTKAVEKRILRDGINYPHLNISHPRTSEDYTLNIQLARDAQIFSIKSNQDLPTTGYSASIERLYPSMLYRTSLIKQILSSRDQSAKREYMMLAIEEIREEFEVTSVEPSKLLSGFTEIPLEWVTGSPENDAVGLLEFETKFAENLDLFIRYHTQKFIKESNSDLTDEEVKEQTEKHLAVGNLPLRLQMYLAGLIRDICKEHYYHTGTISYIQEDDDDDDLDEESGIDEGFTVKRSKRKSSDDDVDDEQNKTKIISRRGRSKYQIDLNAVVFDYLKRAAETYGHKVIIEGIIKLTRMNEHKIANLIVGDGYTLAVDLDNAQIITKDIQDLTNFVIETDENGSSMLTSALTYIDFRGNTINSYPFVLRVFQDGSTNGIEGRTYSIITLFDIVKSYTEGKPLLMGIEFDANKKFTSNIEFNNIREVLVNELREDRYRTYVDENLSDWAIVNRVPKITGTAWWAIHQEEVTTINTDNFLEDLKTTPQELRNLTVQNAFNTIFSQDSETFESENLIELLNWYKDTLFNTHLKSYTKLIKPNSSTTVNNTNLEAVHLFTESTEEKLPEVKPHNYKTLPLEGKQLVNLVDDKGNNVGYITLISQGVFMFVALGEEGSNTVLAQSQPLSKFYLRLLEIQMDANPDIDYTGKHYVATPKTLASILSHFKTDLANDTAPFKPLAVKTASGAKLAGGFTIDGHAMTIYAPTQVPEKPSGSATPLATVLPMLLKAANALDTDNGIQVNHKLASPETHHLIYKAISS